MKTTYITVILMITFLCSSRNLFAAPEEIYFNPGIKLGYSFGKNGGFVWGLEFSVTTVISRSYNQGLLIGAVVDIDFCRNWRRVHFGIESSPFGIDYLCAGIDIGPSITTIDTHTYYGFSVIPYLGAGAYPYFNYTFTGKDSLGLFELGSYIKIPIPTSGNTNHFH
ncbi:MAG: hypothetical protein HYZ54_08195 [Ignavibacteriae bacterium]|nr:hypothetical protein [Ignavibacteriota bacterium]